LRDEPPFTADVPVFIDGSCVAPNTHYPRAAGALVQRRNDDTFSILSFVVPSDWEQTAAAAEHLCVAVLDAALAAGGVAYTDCASVHKSASRGLRFAESERRPWAAVWRYLRWEWAAIHKVKAHLTQQEAAARGESHLWEGNARADVAAKARASSRLPSEAACRDLEAMEKARRAFFSGVAKVLAWYPSLRELAPDRGCAAVQELAAQLELYHGHEVVWWPAKSLWVCLRCGRRAGPKTKRAIANQPCEWAVSKAAGLLHSARAVGHLPQLAFPCKGPRIPLILCVRCGCYAERNPVGLTAPCVVGAVGRRGGIPKGNAYRRCLFARGLHPLTKAAMEGPFSQLPATDVLLVPA
jgi:hypothetical protein